MRIEFSNSKIGKTCIFDNAVAFNTVMSPYDNIVKQYSVQLNPEGTLDETLSKLDFTVSNIKIYDSKRNDNGEIEEYLVEDISDFTSLHTIRYTYSSSDESEILTRSLTITFF